LFDLISRLGDCKKLVKEFRFEGIDSLPYSFANKQNVCCPDDVLWRVDAFVAYPCSVLFKKVEV
jgi:hypothetical protein